MNKLLYSTFFATTFLFSQCQTVDEPGKGPKNPAPAVEWHKGYGTDEGEHIHEIKQVTDGGFLGIGEVSEGEVEATNILVVKTDANGGFLWQKIIGTEGLYDVGICVDELSDGYLIGGGLSNQKQEAYLAKLNFDGSTVWEKTYPASRNGMVRGIAVGDNDEITITGYTGYADAGYAFIADDSQGFVMRVDSKGETQWERRLSTDQGAKIRKTTDGFFVCTTHWMNDDESPQDFFLIKLDEEGNQVWSKNYGGDSDEHCYDCEVTNDGGVILGGHTRSPSYGVKNWDFLLMKVDSEGNEEWHKTFGQPRGYDAKWIHDEAYGVRQTPDGGYVLVGGTGDEYTYSESGSSLGPSDLWMVYAVKVDSQGKLQWEGVYGSTESHDAGEFVDITADGGLIIGTDSDSAGADEFEPNNFGFMKIASDQ